MPVGLNLLRRVEERQSSPRQVILQNDKGKNGKGTKGNGKGNKGKGAKNKGKGKYKGNRRGKGKGEPSQFKGAPWNSNLELGRKLKRQLRMMQQR